MELKINIGYSQVLELVNQLPEKDFQKLMKRTNSRFESPPKERIPMHELIMQAPTWSDEDYNNYLEVRNHINKSRLN